MHNEAAGTDVSETSAFYGAFLAAANESGRRFLIVGDLAENYLINASNRHVRRLEVWLDPGAALPSAEAKLWETFRAKLSAHPELSVETKYRLHETLVLHRDELNAPLTFDRAYASSFTGRFAAHAVRVIQGEDLVAMKLASANEAEVRDAARLLRELREDGTPKLDVEPDGLNTTFRPKFNLH